MRDKKWVLEHRGGALKKEQQKQLVKWGNSTWKLWWRAPGR